MSELDELALEAWTSTPARAKELWKVAKKHPEMARSAATVEWVRRKGYETDSSRDQNALEWAAIGLALHGDPRVVPFLVHRARERWDFARLLVAWLETDRLDKPRLTAAMRPWLTDEESGVHEWKLSSRCLAATGDVASSPLVAEVLGRCFDAMWSTDASITVRMEGHATSLGASLFALGVPRSFVPMLEGVVSVESHSVDRARGTAACLLASLGLGLDPIARGVRWELDHGHPSRVTPGQLLALGALGRELPEEARVGLAALASRVGNEDREGKRALAAAIAKVDLGQPADPAALVRQMLGRVRHWRNDTAEERCFALELVGRRSELPIDVALPFVHDEDTRVHRAAVRALKARGAELPDVRPIDRCNLHLLEPAALRALMGDPATLPKTALAEHLVAHPDPGAIDALSAAFARAPAPEGDDDHGARDLRRDLLRAILATGAPAALPIVAEALAEDPKSVPLDDVPAALAAGVTGVYAKTKDKRLREEAKQWIANKTSEPEVASALEALGLLPEDFSRSPR